MKSETIGEAAREDLPPEDGSRLSAFYGQVDPRDVVAWIDAGKRDPRALEIVYLAHWAHYTGRGAAWCPFDAAAERTARARFVGYVHGCVNGARCRLRLQHDGLRQKRVKNPEKQASSPFGLVPSTPPVPDHTEPAAADLHETEE